MNRRTPENPLGSPTLGCPFPPWSSAKDEASGRNPDGTFARGNTASVTHGGRSRQVQAAQCPEQRERRQHLAEKRTAIVADLGGEATLSRLQLDLVDRYLELDTVAAWLGGTLVAEGPLTAKGRSRAALSAYLTVVDRLQRVSTALGLARRQKSVSLDHYLADTYSESGSRS